jgi:hypothetical protein
MADMGNHHDAEITEIIVVLHAWCDGKLPEMVQRLQTTGMEIVSTDQDNSVVQGTVDATRLAELEKLDCVNYVRVVSTYIADYPPGDPRDKDGVEDEE